ncbi:MAG: hypothetical protein Q8R57_06705 [Bacteroidota bacterium]|nr:hypothetical protein [Bacteroidota bacterium]
MNLIITSKNIYQPILKSKFIVIIVFCFFVKIAFAQINDLELKETIRQKYYKDYVDYYYLRHFGKDREKVEIKYRYTEKFTNYFNSYKFFFIQVTNGPSVGMNYCISNEDKIINNYFLDYIDLLGDSKKRLNNLEKSIIVNLVADGRPLNWLITSDTTFYKHLSSNDFKRFALKDSRGNLYKGYPVRFRRNIVSFYVYKINMNNDNREIIKYTFRYKKNMLKSIEYKFICKDN